MPVAVVYGWDPSMVFAAGNPFSGDEYRIMGAIRQQPVELVKCETSSLQVPASAEIVVEGSISPDPSTYEMEGPFGEFTGFYGGGRRKRPVIDVHCITHRNDPIYRGNMEGMTWGAVSETAFCSYIADSAIMWDILETQGLASGVLDLVPPPISAIKIHKSYQGQARHIAAALWGSKLAVQMFKTIMVVEEDVDIHNLRELVSAIHANVDPAKHLIVFPMDMSSPADTSLSSETADETSYGAGLGSKLLVDATIDWATHPKRAEWDGKRVSPRCTEPPLELAERVKKKWAEYGFES